MRFEKISLIGLTMAGIITWSLVMVKSGLLYSYGIGYWGPNGHDGIWHISLIESIARGRWGMPIFAGETIKNYHVGFDAFVALLVKLTHIPATVWYFQLLPPLSAVLLAILVWKFTQNWKKSYSFSAWAIFFTFFGSNFGWVVTLIKEGQLGGDSLFWAQQATTTLINPPYAWSLVVFTLGLVFLQSKKIKSAIVIFSLLPQIKIYAGILALGGLIVAGWKYRWLWKVAVPSLILALVLFIPFNRSAGGLIEVRPLWFLENIFTPDRLDWPKLVSALSTYKSGGVWVKSIPLYIGLLGVFLFGNLGTRAIGILSAIKKQYEWEDLLLLSMAGGGIVCVLVLLQKGTAWNTIQFFYYSQFILGFYAAQSLARVKKWGIGVVAVVLTVPGTFATLRHYLPSRPPAMVAVNELKALKFLKSQNTGIVLTVPFDKNAAAAAQTNPPRPLYLYESTAYVSAFSAQPVYMEDEVNLTITDYAWEKRRADALNFFRSPTLEFLSRANVTYIYIAPHQIMLPLENSIPLTTIYDNEGIKIYKVSKENSATIR